MPSSECCLITKKRGDVCVPMADTDGIAVGSCTYDAADHRCFPRGRLRLETSGKLRRETHKPPIGRPREMWFAT
jgi:hypothetical protein